jgi:Lrp/AsnC family transcriptional regulator, leucine-responsive regulatory protein
VEALMPTINLDDLDRAILRDLQADGRMTNLDLARSVGLSPAATHARVRRLEQSGAIQRYAALVDPEMAGFDLLCLISIGIQLHHADAVARTRAALASLPEVLECHHLTGQFDYLLKVVLPDRRALERFVVERLTPLPGIARIQTSVVLAVVKSTTALPI